MVPPAREVHVSARDRFEIRRSELVQRAWAATVRYGAIGPRHRAAERFHSFGNGSMISCMFPKSVKS